METLFISLLVFLVFFALFDLFVGVSNDAVNFLNSAIGCKIARLRTIMVVAGLGVLLGATFSSGMMEIARSGIFNPEMFTFHEIMIIFFAVMAADIILLNTFNHLGLPTSTTVSIVFELFGAALAAAAVKLLADGASLTEVFAYINSSKTLSVISGILTSVVVAFVCGVLVQYPVRLLFGFNYEKMYRRIGGVFGALCITAIFYFLVMKGAKGASFMRPEWLAFIKDNTGTILSVLFVGFSVLFQSLILFTRVNIFKIVILAGTFSLAFAFAGNDLVNFVGVPLAAFDSWKLWTASGVSPDAMTMGTLKAPAQASTLFLLGAGAIMVATLWFSKKAKNVIKTSIGLSSAKSGEEEKFGATLPSRLIVRSALQTGSLVNQIIPKAVSRSLNSRFEPKKRLPGEEELPFDCVRASVNLMVSAILIACATSLKLPLSTTYVTFMVAMGSSFADRAWDRETAVYRISGVLTVISGWFMTAISASFLAGALILAIYGLGEWSCYVIGLLVLFLIYKSNFSKQAASEKAREEKLFPTAPCGRPLLPVERLSELSSLYASIAASFIEDKETALRSLKRSAHALNDSLSRERVLSSRSEMVAAGKDSREAEHLHARYRAVTALTLASQSVFSLAEMAEEHVANRHSLWDEELGANIRGLASDVKELVESAAQPDASRKAEHCVAKILRLQSEFLDRAPEEQPSVRSGQMYLNFLLCAREIIKRCSVAGQVLRTPEDRSEAKAQEMSLRYANAAQS